MDSFCRPLAQTEERPACMGPVKVKALCGRHSYERITQQVEYSVEGGTALVRFQLRSQNTAGSFPFKTERHSSPRRTIPAVFT